MNPTFPYKPVAKAGDEIRLLTLLPARLAWKLEGEDDSAAEPIIECRLDHYSLADWFPPYETWLDGHGCDAKVRQKEWSAYVAGWASRNARDEGEADAWTKTARNRFRWGDYWALSYVWGDTSKTRPILLNGALFRVTENLHAALSRLAEEPHHAAGGDKLWVDAICINQSDLAEREGEVARMGDIYANARGVEVWLGSPISGEHGQTIRGWKELYGRDGDEGPEGLLRTDISAAGAIVHSVARLSFEPYWERVWVIQELALASSESLFFYGRVQLSLHEMYSIIRFGAMSGNWDGHYAAGDAVNTSYSISAMKSLRRAFELVTRAIIPLVSRGNGGSDPLAEHSEMLSLVAGGKATDPRDKAYGVRALLPTSLSARIPPDYSVGKDTVWGRLTKAVIEESGNLNVLASSKLAIDGDLPSWVLNLDSPRSGHFQSCHASGHIEPCFRFSDDCRVLRCQGFRVDRIATVGAKASLDAQFSTGAAVKIDFPNIIEQSPGSESRQDVVTDDELRLGVLQVLTGDPSTTLHHLDGPTVLDFPMVDLMSVLEKLNTSLVMGEDEGEYRGSWMRQNAPEEDTDDVASVASTSDDYEAGASNDEPGDEDISPEDAAREWLDFAVQHWRHLAAFFMWRRANAGFKIAGHELADFFHWDLKRPPRDREGLVGLVERAGTVCGCRAIAMTEEGRLGLAPAPTRPGDEVNIVLGCDWPLVMRPRGNGQEIVGSCFVDGLMLGDAVSDLQPGGWDDMEWLTVL